MDLMQEIEAIVKKHAEADRGSPIVVVVSVAGNGAMFAQPGKNAIAAGKAYGSIVQCVHQAIEEMDNRLTQIQGPETGAAFLSGAIASMGSPFESSKTTIREVGKFDAPAGGGRLP